MTVSAGFYKKIYDWVIDEKSGKVAFQPFQVDGNPYKSKVILVRATPESLPQEDLKDVKLYVDSLVDAKLFKELNSHQIKTVSREYKGCINFVTWMKEHYSENVVLANVNSLVESTQHLKQIKKKNDALYKKGIKIFEEVLNEFKPEIIILQGSTVLKQFREQFENQLIFHNDSFEKVQQLEQMGVFAEFPLQNGQRVKILGCRSMTYFGKDGVNFGEFKFTLDQLLS